MKIELTEDERKYAISNLSARFAEFVFDVIHGARITYKLPRATTHELLTILVEVLPNCDEKAHDIESYLPLLQERIKKLAEETFEEGMKDINAEP